MMMMMMMTLHIKFNSLKIQLTVFLMKDMFKISKRISRRTL